jgi:hypothetical protein
VGAALARDLVAGRASAEHWADEVLPSFDRGPLYFPLHELARPAEEIRAVALAINEALCAARRRRDLPEAIAEIDVKRPGRDRFEPDGYRSQLPHHDGQHCTYLTPSLLDVPEFDPRYRVFSMTPLSITSDNHKLTHGLLVENAGEGPSVTVYLNLIQILFDAHRHLVGPVTGIEAVARWLGENTQRAVVQGERYGGRYPSLGARLGLASPAYAQFQVFGRRGFTDEQKAVTPELVERCAACPCGRCEGESCRVFCWSTTEGLGCAYPEFRERYECRVPNVRDDLILAENLALLHGQNQGHHTRRTTNLYMVVPTAAGDAYERFLASRWRVYAPPSGVEAAGQGDELVAGRPEAAEGLAEAERR